MIKKLVQVLSLATLASVMLASVVGLSCYQSQWGLVQSTLIGLGIFPVLGTFLLGVIPGVLLIQEGILALLDARAKGEIPLSKPVLWSAKYAPEF